ncbi:MAG: TlyA family RNA methyltransferase [Puniceicoccales bacterium]|jgi:23S rRNA (cytidine1920-2'-O)/16S rRNA (cytidine1409-2'-O)-methyltransferase|nr:TlyA family RNA methyltransferase [Puniceicoccales bacterium]
MSSRKIRADELVVMIGLAESRTQAQKLILAGQVMFPGGMILDKPSRELEVGTKLQIRYFPRYVGRGGEKLEGFFQCHSVELSNCCALDIGASTGGFTDYLLQHGIASVSCVDVGHGQLHYKLRIDPRVSNFEGVNARRLAEVALPHSSYDIIVIDVSFISLTKILPSAWKFLKENGLLVALVKPQFEAALEEVSRGRGVILDENIHRRVCREIRNFSSENLTGCQIVAEVPSPISGADGNREFFIGMRKKL